MKELLSGLVGLLNPIDDMYGFVKTVVLLIVGGLLAIVPSCASYNAGYQLGYAKAKLFGKDVVEPMEPDSVVPSPLGVMDE